MGSSMLSSVFLEAGDVEASRLVLCLRFLQSRPEKNASAPKRILIASPRLRSLDGNTS